MLLYMLLYQKSSSFTNKVYSIPFYAYAQDSSFTTELSYTVLVQNDMSHTASLRHLGRRQSKRSYPISPFTRSMEHITA